MENILLDNIETAIRLLHKGKLVAIPTETVYGLAADSTNVRAVKKIYEVKGRPKTLPLSILIAHHADLTNWAINIPEIAFKLAKTYWPGSLTLILQRATNVSKIITAGKDSIGLRCPNHPITQQILQSFPYGLAAPSANPYGKPPPTNAEMVKNYFADKVDLIIDGGACEIGLASTIVDLTSAEPKILRQGVITPEMIEKMNM